MVPLKEVSLVQFCFLLAINDLSPKGVKVSRFADDTPMWGTGEDVQLNAKIQDTIQEWCGKWVFNMSWAKTSVVVFHQSKNNKIKICFNGSVLKRVEKIKILGLIFNRRLSSKSHIEYLVDKC